MYYDCHKTKSIKIEEHPNYKLTQSIYYQRMELYSVFYIILKTTF